MAKKIDREALARALPAMLDKALTVQAPLVRTHLDRLTKARPARTSAELIERLEKEYLAAVTTMGGAAGLTAAVPGAGTAVALPINLLEVAGFLDSSVLFVLALADVHGIAVSDVHRRRTLVLAILLGEGGSTVVEKVAGRTGPHLARRIVKSVPMTAIHKINAVLGKNFVTKYGTKQGILVLGRELPVGIGALIGGGGNLALGYATVRAARRVFGEPAQDDAFGVGQPIPEPTSPQDEASGTATITDSP